MRSFRCVPRLPGWQSLALVCFGMGLGYFAGLAAGPLPHLHADVTEEPRREAFKAGSSINEPVLREIAATLGRIEKRVERIEKNTSAAAPLKPGAATGNSVPVHKAQPVIRSQPSSLPRTTE